MVQDGQIKYHCEHKHATLVCDPLYASEFFELNALRQKLFQSKDIGITADGIGYGNISMPYQDGFLISASATGGIKELNFSHYSLVKEACIEKNTLSCLGKLKASSESLSHAAVYQASSIIKCVVHIHNALLFYKLLKTEALKTPPHIAYGTVEMAKSIATLVKLSPQSGLIVMQGHEEGIIFYGTSINKVEEMINTVKQ